MFGDDWAAQPAPAPTPPRDASEEETHRALYLRWRPRRFADVVGQEHVTRTLRNAVQRGRLAHAYLFTGPRGTGKTSVARILYRAANCEHTTDGDPCNVCPLCLAALDGRAMDLVEIDAASNRGIDDIRDLRDKVAYRPGEGRYRLYIIDEAHELTAPAWDAFLKTLEEPPAHAIFVMATTESHKVPATIVSRCQRFDFRRIPFDATRDQLLRVAKAEGLEVDEAVLDRLARAARGGLRDALSLLDQLGAFAGGHVDMAVARAVLGLPPAEAVRGAVEALGRRDPATVMGVVAEIAEGGADLRQFVDELVSNLRALLLMRSGADASLASEFPFEDLVWLRSQAPSWTVGGLIALVRDLATALARTRDAQQFQVQVELALLGASQDGLLARDVPPVPAAPRPQAAASRQASASLAAQPVEKVTGPAAGHAVAERSAATATGAAPTQPSEPQAASAATAVPEAVVEVPPASPAVEAPVEPLEIALAVQRWPDVVELVRARKPLVAAAMSTARPLRIEGQTLVVDFGTRFHRGTAEKTANRPIIEAAIKQAVGQELRLRCTVGSEGETGSSLFDDPVINFAARTFGGEPRRVPPTASGDGGSEAL